MNDEDDDVHDDEMMIMIIMMMVMMIMIMIKTMMMMMMMMMMVMVMKCICIVWIRILFKGASSCKRTFSRGTELKAFNQEGLRLEKMAKLLVHSCYGHR